MLVLSGNLKVGLINDPVVQHYTIQLIHLDLWMERPFLLNASKCIAMYITVEDIPISAVLTSDDDGSNTSLKEGANFNNCITGWHDADDGLVSTHYRLDTFHESNDSPANDDSILNPTVDNDVGAETGSPCDNDEYYTAQAGREYTSLRLESLDTTTTHESSSVGDQGDYQTAVRPTSIQPTNRQPMMRSTTTPKVPTCESNIRPSENTPVHIAITPATQNEQPADVTSPACPCVSASASVSLPFNDLPNEQRSPFQQSPCKVIASVNVSSETVSASASASLRLPNAAAPDVTASANITMPPLNTTIPTGTTSGPEYAATASTTMVTTVATVQTVTATATATATANINTSCL